MSSVKRSRTPRYSPYYGVKTPLRIAYNDSVEGKISCDSTGALTLPAGAATSMDVEKLAVGTGATYTIANTPANGAIIEGQLLNGTIYQYDANTLARFARAGTGYVDISGIVAGYQGVRVEDGTTIWAMYKPTSTTDLRFNVAGVTDVLTLKNTGKVGVGTTAPYSKFDVVGNMSVGSNFGGAIEAPTNGAIIEGNTLIGTSDNTSGARLHVRGSGGLVMMRLSETDNSAIFTDFGHNASYHYLYAYGLPMTFGNSAEIMRFPSGTQNVLIGTTTDDGFKLRVNGTAKIDGLATVPTGVLLGSSFPSGTTSATLSRYLEASPTIHFSTVAAGASLGSKVFTVTRIGRVVTCHIPAFTYATGSGALLTVTALHVDFRPSADTCFKFMSYEDVPTFGDGYAEVRTDGFIEFYQSPGVTWTGGGALCGSLLALSFTWTV